MTKRRRKKELAKRFRAITFVHRLVRLMDGTDTRPISTFSWSKNQDPAMWSVDRQIEASRGESKRLDAIHLSGGRK